MSAASNQAQGAAEQGVAGVAEREAWTIESLSKDQRSTLAYVESCAVDAGGLLESIRLNAADMQTLQAMHDAGLLQFGRVPGSMLGTGLKPWTHWVVLNDSGWQLAAQVRRKRAEQRGPFAREAIPAATQGAAK